MTETHHDAYSRFEDGFPPLDDVPLAAPAPGAAPRKPCIALMGEFSAGKSTLSNLLIGQSPLPVKVTATQLPPVRISHGTGQGWREDHDGRIHPLDIEALTEVTPADTRLVQLFVEADLLTLCDLIDMPGISDPNMDSGVWEGVIGQADGVIWCTHATQAWRQSEAAVWEELSGRLAQSSLLLLTRADKLVTAEDRARVLKRVVREAAGLFSAILPISLTEAVAGRDDWDRWTASGAEAFSQHFIGLLDGFQGATPQAADNAARAAAFPEAPPLTQDPAAGTDDGARPRRVTIDRERGRSVRPGSEPSRGFGLA
ncbi:dynamin family protein [Rhodovulum euryhalinum]|uniref:Dynamin family protein n=1 Tax=Rhodovulum euryhalinum TaxID=35805 RepID=A0A4R2KKY2_9RHOB|nr:dynamin family protein [Rhodovulum euryhalinum]TCO74014.1 dynamin family protein [Rhodovulum euryhalinum]